MKTIFAIGLTLILFGAVQSAVAQKTVFVDSDKILQEMPEAKQADAMLASAKKQGEDSLMSIQREYQQKMEIYQKQQGMMTPENRAAEEGKLNAIKDRFQKFQQEFFGQEGMYYKYRQQVLAPLLEKVTAVIKKVVATEKASVVMESKSVLYFDPKLDITYKVIVLIKSGSN